MLVFGTKFSSTVGIIYYVGILIVMCQKNIEKTWFYVTIWYTRTKLIIYTKTITYVIALWFSDKSIRRFHNAIEPPLLLHCATATAVEKIQRSKNYQYFEQKLHRARELGLILIIMTILLCLRYSRARKLPLSEEK